MPETQFNALMYCGNYVDANRLNEGVYACSKPFIYNNGETIKQLVELAKMAKDLSGNFFVSGQYIDNLKKCELVPISVTIKTQP